MNLRDLHYLVTLAELKNFNKAAAHCFVSQPTLSAQLKKLEEELGVQLFERNNKKSLITPIGQSIVNQALVILREAKQLKEIALSAKDPFSGVFRLGIIPTIGPYLLPKILPLIKKHFPKLKVLINEDKTVDILNSLHRGELDAVILALPVPHEGLHVEMLFKEPFYVALSKQHKLRKQSAISLNDLRNENLLLLEEGHCLRDQIIDICAVKGIKESTGFHATSLETLIQIVSNNNGITLLPKMACQRNKHISLRPMRHPVPSRTVAMLWRKQSARQVCCQHIAEKLSIMHIKDQQILRY